MSRLVRIKADVDYRKLPLSPSEGNVFTRIDGKNTEADIVRITGFHPETVSKALDRLLDLGAAELANEAITKEAAQKEARIAKLLAFGGFDVDAPIKYENRLLNEEVEIELTKKKLILFAFSRLDTLTFYELLGVHRLADKKQIKAAYYLIAPEFHPDKFYRKNLGSFKPKLEAIFAKLTRALDVLSDRDKRAQYEEYLLAQEETRKAEALLGGGESEIEKARAAIEREARLATEDGKQKALVDDRRRALAAKLTGALGKPGAKPAAQAAPAAQPLPLQGLTVDPRAAGQALRARYEYARAEAQRAQVAKYVNAGRDALHRGDFASAANNFKIAASVAPDDPVVQQEAAEVEQQAATALADSFVKQGDYEAAQSRWAEASICYNKACQGKPNDARVYDKAAHATFKANNNPRRAVELARRAIELAPRVAQYHITLGYAYMASGLETSALGELDRAIEVSNGDGRVKELVDAARDTIRRFVERSKQPPSVRPRVPSSGAVPAQGGAAAGAQDPSVPPPPQPAGWASSAGDSGRPQDANGFPSGGYPSMAPTGEAPAYGYPQAQPQVFGPSGQPISGGAPQANGYAPQGYPPQGYAYGPQGYPPQGYPPQGHSTSYAPPGYGPQAYPQGYGQSYGPPGQPNGPGYGSENNGYGPPPGLSGYPPHGEVPGYPGQAPNLPHGWNGGPPAQTPHGAPHAPPDATLSGGAPKKDRR